ncbi:mycothiol synthase [Lipingzhangella sp. LS1_29]|uniref:Mycothiol acetyltransferase n=1 Tax=Lipingzhangella rawalii TaxID=2055835 RepID=A0ABU2HBD0_9ACTN|nr:mycothiol synthase [Lipingzhangella rawalii]MDS1271894.1 mycothiol synthase [Lipingzhangella rawalii]
MIETYAAAELPAQDAAAIRTLADEAERQDRVASFSEQTLLRARPEQTGDTDTEPPTEARFLLLRADEPDQGAAGLAGVAFLEVTGPQEAAAELVVHPELRGAGRGGQLVRALLEESTRSGHPRPRIWAHGQLPAAQALARAFGLERVRGLLRMRMRLHNGEPLPLPEVKLSSELAERLHIRTFVPGADEQSWLATNSRAFADHPEQGGLHLSDLRQREAEEWFDPNGFFLAEDRVSGDIAGFHWTKIHADGAGLTPGEPVGEVYVVGVDPAWQGTGLGRVLTVTGLRYLRDRGLPWVLLFVDEDNRPAVDLYGGLGFTLWDADVMYQPAPAAS